MMSRLISMGVIAAAVAFSPAAMADQVVGTVDEVAGGLGDFVVMRDGVAYSLRSGDAVRIGDILRGDVAEEIPIGTVIGILDLIVVAKNGEVDTVVEI